MSPHLSLEGYSKLLRRLKAEATLDRCSDRLNKGYPDSKVGIEEMDAALDEISKQLEEEEQEGGAEDA